MNNTDPRMQPYITHSSCRVCGSSDLVDLFSLGEHYINDFPRFVDESMPKSPIDLLLCKNCSVVQLRHTARQELLYSGEYFYKSGTSSTMRDQLRSLVEDIEAVCPLSDDDLFVDIGANDGTMLSYVKDAITVGIEPASNLAKECERNCDIFIPDFWGFHSYWNAVGRKAKVITAVGMFYDTDDPNQFIEDASKVLDFNGVFVAQLMCLRNMLECNDVSNLCAEHLLYFSLKSLHYLFNRHGLEIFDIERNDVNGESYRIWSRHIGSNIKARPGALARMAAYEYRERGIEDLNTYRDFYDEMRRNRDEVREFIDSEHRLGRRIWIRGCSTKGNTILQWLGVGADKIEGGSDAAAWKHGRFTVGSWIPIHPLQHARERADTFIILPFAFTDEIVKQESEWFKGGGKRFMIPLPKMRVIE